MLRKKKNFKNNFLLFNFNIENTKENQTLLKLVKSCCILNLFNLYIIENNKLNEFKEAYKIIIDFEFIFLISFIFSFLLNFRKPNILLSYICSKK